MRTSLRPRLVALIGEVDLDDLMREVEAELQRQALGARRSRSFRLMPRCLHDDQGSSLANRRSQSWKLFVERRLNPS